RFDSSTAHRPLNQVFAFILETAFLGPAAHLLPICCRFRHATTLCTDKLVFPSFASQLMKHLLLHNVVIDQLRPAWEIARPLKAKNNRVYDAHFSRSEIAQFPISRSV